MKQKKYSNPNPTDHRELGKVTVTLIVTYHSPLVTLHAFLEVFSMPSSRVTELVSSSECQNSNHFLF